MVRLPSLQAVVVLDDWMGREHLVEPLPVEAASPVEVEEGVQNGAAESKDEATGSDALASPAGQCISIVLLCAVCVSVRKSAVQEMAHWYGHTTLQTFAHG